MRTFIAADGSVVRDCPSCDGTGRVATDADGDSLGVWNLYADCDDCEGDAVIDVHPLDAYPIPPDVFRSAGVL